MRLETLRTFSDQLHEDTMEDEKAIDFGSVGLYLAGLQVCFAIVCCGCASVLCCWLMPPAAISAVRTLAITTTIGMILVRKPVRVGHARGVVTVFNALRPSIAIYLLALVLEQLVHTCVGLDLDDDEHSGAVADRDGAKHARVGGDEGRGTLRRALFHAITAFMILSGFIRAKNPRSESDVPFLVTAACLLAVAVLPPPAVAKTGPLCEPTTLLGAGERVLRATLFAAVYVVLVYAAAPNRNQSNELFICVARATAASVWVLSASSWALPLAPVQVAVVLFARLHDDSGAMMHATEVLPPHYGSEHVPLTGRGAMTPIDGNSDVELGDIGVVTDPEALRLALAGQRHLGTPPINGLSFSIPASRAQAAHGGLNGAAVAAIVAREAACGGAGS